MHFNVFKSGNSSIKLLDDDKFILESDPGR